MKSKWKYDNQISLLRAMLLYPILLGMAMVFLISSCNSKDEHKHISTNKASELDGLAQPTNQTVFSDIKTISPIQQSITPILNATGVISYDPRLINNISARFSGRIEKLYVRFNFEDVSKGQRIMDVYSPEIVTAQENFIFLMNNSANDSALLSSSKQELKLLGLTDEQLKQLTTTKQVINPVPVFSPYSGHLHDIGISSGVTSSSSSMNSGMSSGMNSSSTSTTQTQIENLPSSQSSSLSIKEGMYLQRGQPIFAVYNTNQVWAILNIFPLDAALIKTGDKVILTAETNPANIISSTISYIEPIAGQNSSVIKARVYLQNAENLHLKIGTLLSAKITTTGIKGMWLPRNAVVNLGLKQIVFLKDDNYFTAKTIHTGIVTDSLVQVISGLQGNEKLAASAQYMVDSESFIQTEINEQK